MKPVYQPEIFIAQRKEKFDSLENLKDEKVKEFLRKKLNKLKDLVLEHKI